MMDSSDVIIEKALSENIISERELVFIHEALPAMNGGVKMFSEIISKFYEKEGMMERGLVHHICCYLFAKAVEAVILWGGSKDGKFSIVYLPQDITHQTPNPKVPVKFHPLIHESMKYGEILFLAHDEWVRSQMKNDGLEFDLRGEIHKTLFWISKIGVTHARGKKYHLLLQRKKSRFWEFFIHRPMLNNPLLEEFLSMQLS